MVCVCMLMPMMLPFFFFFPLSILSLWLSFIRNEAVIVSFNWKFCAVAISCHFYYLNCNVLIRIIFKFEILDLITVFASNFMTFVCLYMCGWVCIETAFSKHENIRYYSPHTKPYHMPSDGLFLDSCFKNGVIVLRFQWQSVLNISLVHTIFILNFSSLVPVCPHPMNVLICQTDYLNYQQKTTTKVRKLWFHLTY